MRQNKTDPVPPISVDLLHETSEVPVREIVSDVVCVSSSSLGDRASIIVDVWFFFSCGCCFL